MKAFTSKRDVKVPQVLAAWEELGLLEVKKFHCQTSHSVTNV